MASEHPSCRRRHMPSARWRGFSVGFIKRLHRYVVDATPSSARTLPACLAPVLLFTVLALVAVVVVVILVPVTSGAYLDFVFGAGRQRGASLPDTPQVDPRLFRPETNFRIIVVVPSTIQDLPAFEALLLALRNARYDDDFVAIDLFIAPGWNSSPADERFEICRRFEWPHGDKSLRNTTSGGHFDIIMDAWTPTRGDSTQVLIVEATRAQPPSQNFYRYLKSVRKLYKSRSADFAGFAFQPVPVRREHMKVISSDKHLSKYESWYDNFFVASEHDELDVFLYQILPQNVGMFVPLNADVWRSFRNWFMSYRHEWFIWPVVVNAKDKRDPMWSHFTGTTRAHWTHWFSRFSVQNRLYTLYPTKMAPNPFTLRALSSPVETLRTYNFKGDVVTFSASVSLESLARIVELGQRGGGFISMTVVNKAFLSTARSWICNVDEGGFRPPGVVWIVTDTESLDVLKDIPGSETIHLEEFRGGNEAQGTSYGTPGYWLLMLERTRLIREILDRGIGIFAFETDQIWLRDPVPHVRRLVNSGDEVDVVGTLDSRHEIGGNFLFLSPTIATRRLWREISTRFEKNFYSLRMHQRTPTKHRYMENDQSLLTKLIFFDENFKHRNPVVFRALDTELFVDGRWYEYPSAKVYSTKRARSPVLINNNFLIGIEAKRRRAIANRHWFVQSDNRTCDSAAVQSAIAENDARAEGIHTAYPSDLKDVEVNLDGVIEAIAIEQRKH